ncbi:MAG: ribosome silencing factor [Wujia sp.]
MVKKELLKVVVAALEDKQAGNIRVIDIHDVSTMGDYFIIADGKNRNQVQAMCDNVEEFMHKAGAELKNREGYANGGWILLDYYDIIVHIFSEEERSFYDLEHIWRDGSVVSVGDL